MIPAFGQTGETFTYKSYSQFPLFFIGQAYVVELDENGFPVEFSEPTFARGAVTSYYVDAYGKLSVIIGSNAFSVASDGGYFGMKNFIFFHFIFLC